MDKWSEGLPEDVFDRILNLCSLRDSIRVGLVRKSWHRVSRLNISKRPPQLPWLMMLSNPNCRSAEQEGEDDRCLYSLSDDTIYYGIKIPHVRGKKCCASFNNSGGWLMTIDQNLEVQLFHPWHRIHFKLPSFSNVSKISPHFEPSKTTILKAAISDDAAVVALLNTAYNIAFCRRGKDEMWTRISLRHQGLRDIIYHKGQFYVVYWNGKIGVVRINTENPYVETLTGEVNFISNSKKEIPKLEVSTILHHRTYLVPDLASESIFIIRRLALVNFVSGVTDIYTTYDFLVFELGLDESGASYKKKFVEVESLGDRVMFLGLNSSMIVMASQFSGFKGNCIYFTHDWEPQNLYSLPSGRADMGIFNMEDRTILPLFPNRDHPSFSPPIWITPPQVQTRFHHQEASEAIRAYQDGRIRNFVFPISSTNLNDYQ